MFATAHSDSDSEVQPLIRPMQPRLVGKLCLVGVLAVLVSSWCVLDSWNRDATSRLFTGTKPQLQISLEPGKIENDGKLEHMLPLLTSLTGGVQSFEYPFTLVFLQFFFMAVVFSVIWLMTSSKPALEIANFQDTTTDYRWSVLAITHVFSTFWLQMLVLPHSEMSLGLFAASRAVEIPAAGFMRTFVFSSKLGRKSWMTTLLMFGAACSMIYAYTQIMNCVCIWSGFGVAVSGTPFLIICTLLLVMPAASAVCQEVALVELQTPLFLVLAFQSVCSCGVCAIGLYISRILGYEDCVIALRILSESPKLQMLTLWLCVQLAATSWVTLQIISMTDSFWGIALKCTRVIYWQLQTLFAFYASSNIPYSIAHPRSSLWSFVLVCGALLGAAAIFSDPQLKDKTGRDAPKLEAAKV